MTVVPAMAATVVVEAATTATNARQLTIEHTARPAIQVGRFSLDRKESLALRFGLFGCLSRDFGLETLAAIGRGQPVARRQHRRGS